MLNPVRVFVPLILFLVTGTSSFGYSVLSHEAMIDALWEVRLKAVLLAQFPGSTPERFKEAHSYAYGGAIIQDMGYYPNADGYFSDLTHYARSADFIRALISGAETLDEYAFALGALSHYASDNNGHRLATNVGVPLLYPKLRKKYGGVVTYDDSPSAHLRTEYAFDVAEVAEGNYAPAGYHDFIGFNVSKSLLQRAFRETYGFDLAQMFDLDLAIGSYRHTLSTLIPFFTRVAWADHKDKIQQARPGVTKKQFLYVMHRSSYEREWGTNYEEPSVLDRIVAFMVKLLPPIGRIRILKFRPLTPDVEQLFMKSFVVATQEYQGELSELNRDREGADKIQNTNLDLGTVTQPGVYKLQDETYAYWLNRLSETHFISVPPEVKRDILKYYQDPNTPIATKARPGEWQRVLKQLEQLKLANAGPEPLGDTPGSSSATVTASPSAGVSPHPHERSK